MKVISTEKLPIKMWLDDIEDGALQQAKNLANLPFAYKWISIMPDSHSGYGMPIGGVMATNGVIVPNAVGVDIGCLDKDTEFLSESGWKKMNEYVEGDRVLQYNKNNEIASFVNPINYIVKGCDTFYHFENSKGLDQMLSEEHKMIVWQGYKNRGYKIKDYSPLEISEKSLEKGFYGVKCCFNILQEGVNYTDNEIRLLVALSADGYIRKETKMGNRISFHLKKERKVNRLIDILGSLNISFKNYFAKDGTNYIEFYLDTKFKKSLSFLWKANFNQLKVACEESLLWDGHSGYRNFFSSSIKENADAIQFAFSATGIRAGIYVSKSKKYKDIYFVVPTKNSIVGINKHPEKVNSLDNKKYCFTVPDGYFIIRRNNKISITGNCGMNALQTSLTDISTEELKTIMGKIREVVPVGFNHQEENQIWSGFDQAPDIPIIQEQIMSSKKQLGTLGGGNHFIEIQKGSDDHIWIMIHSGSRNFGLKTANVYHKMAQKLCETWFSNIPDKDLAFLPIESKEGKEYFQAMKYCLDFAKANRNLMMKNVFDCLDSVVPCSKMESIDIHHNYAAFENHYGKDVLVHRKGATKASVGLTGIIPGSMGTSSYITEGLGNPESFESCSHGAGRKMGRKEAERTLNLAEEQEKMIGIVHGLRNTSNLDEAPGAYKNIDEVMENQKDLVKIKVSLKPLASVKG